MNREQVIVAAVEFVRAALEKDSSGHDWWHIERVTKLAREIAAGEGADVYVCELAALLHDIADEKFNESEAAGLSRVREWLEAHDVEPEVTAHVLEIISTMSFKGGNRKPMATLEGQVVQDADRLDALGAIGIARTFAYSGWKGQAMHDPEFQPRTDMTAEEYRQGKSTAVAHFYEKLLKLREYMNTPYAKRLAEGRHQAMLDFLDRFYMEWEGKM
jgi:uncharacterized protein